MGTIFETNRDLFAQVAVARPIGGALSYSIPAALIDQLEVGHVVLVPLGRRGAETGYVVGKTNTVDFDVAKVKPIQRLIDDEKVFNAEQLHFFRWIANYYLVPLGMVIQTAIPSQIRARVLLVLRATEAGIEALTRQEVPEPTATLLREIISRPDLTQKGLLRRLGNDLDAPEVKRGVSQLVRREWIEWGEREIGETKGAIRTVRLTMPLNEAMGVVPRAGKRMRAIMDSLDSAGGALDLPNIIRSHGSSARQSLKRLDEEALLQWGTREKRDALLEAPALGPTEALQLNGDQQVALEALTTQNAAGTYLLYGVTGSGKTEVFLDAAEHTLTQSKQVLVLVPEIGLTPQLVGRFRARFGDKVAVLHSGLTGGERLGEWRKIRANEAQIAVGARSALFAPFSALGLIVVDEEHDDSYKQDDGVPYNARDLAVVLGKLRACPVVLASATPSMESWHNGKKEHYKVLHLPKRATPRNVPKVELVDLTAIPVKDGEPRPIFSDVAISALQDAFDAGGKGIVLYNRRGYATLIQCTSCGGTYECPNCGISMTLHQRSSRMCCHYCNLSLSYTGECPVCRSRSLEELGKGTERVVEELEDIFPEIPIARMDADSTSIRGAHHRILADFRAGKTRLLVGTQIVAKGHDFPDVHTAVVVSADQGFRLPDFRAGERTFSLLVQMAGRAGRGERAGHVVVQTWKPDHYVLKNLDHVDDFYRRELRLRDAMRYPPFSRLCLVRVDGVNRRQVGDATAELARTLRGLAKEHNGVAVLGPALAALAKLVGRWRYQIILRGQQLKEFRRFIKTVHPLLERASRKGVRVRWDVDPRSLL